MKLFDTQLPQMYSKGLFEEKCLDLAPEHTDKMLDIVLTGTANILNHNKSKDKATAFTFKLPTGVLVAAAIVRFFENEDKSNPGNWSLVWTFDEADIPEGSITIDIADVQTHSYFIAAAGEKYGIQFEDTGSLVNCLVYVLMQLKKWLDENVKEGTDVSVEMDGFFQARATVENGVKIFALEPAGEIKMLIKDDAAIEK